MQADPYDPQLKETYDLVIGSNQLMKKIEPNDGNLSWDYAAADAQYIDLYRTLKKYFNEKNQHV